MLRYIKDISSQTLFKNVLQGLSNLSYLDLGGCGIEFIEDGAFAGLASLSEMFASANHLTNQSFGISSA
jgi:hypothetical protein